MSLRNRFLALSAGLALILVGVAVYAEHAASQLSSQNKDLARIQRDVGAALETVSDRLHSLGIGIYQGSIGGIQSPPADIKAQLNALRSEVSDLAQRSTQLDPETLSDPVAALAMVTDALTTDVEALVETQLDPERRLPAMPIMLNKLAPTNIAFISALTVALEEAKSEPPTPQNRAILAIFHDLHYDWAQMVSSVRVFVANKLGAFGSPPSGLNSNDTDRKLYASEIQRLLSHLRGLDREGKLTLSQADVIAQLTELNARFEANFKEIADIFYSDNWRADTTLLRTKVDPRLAQAWVKVAAIRQQLDRIAQMGFVDSAATTQTISNFVWMISAITFLVLIFGYLAFEFIIRRPIMQVAKALEAEGRGDTYLPTLRHAVPETESLVKAFATMREQVRSRQSRLQAILDNAGEGIFTFSREGIIETFNDAAERLFGYKEIDVIGKDVATLLPGSIASNASTDLIRTTLLTDADVFGIEHETLGQRANGESFPMSLRLGRAELADGTLYTALVSDISERRSLVDRLTTLAERDSLTGLHNRHFLLEELERVMEQVGRSGHGNFALLYMDLDNFKYVNDTLGHLAGDRLLQDVAEILRSRARNTDLLTRLGGDEFAVLLYDVDRPQASAVADAYRRQLADFIFRSEGGLVDVGCSIGVAMLDADIKTKEDLLSRADVACHIAKRAGKNRIHLFEPHDQENVDTMSADMGWARRIKDCMELDRFVLTSQPIVDILTGKVSSYELLLRMPDDSGGLVMPSGFLPAAERFGLSGEVDHWVVRAALREVRASSLDNPVNYSVNLSAKSIGDKSLLKLIRRELENHEMDARRVVFEVTETGAIANLHAAALFLQELRGMGFRTALDDFGVGYSSFAYLKDLPVDYVKIDGSFVQGVTQDKVKQAIVKAMNDVAHALGKQTVAEFVEDQATLDFLKEARIDFCQGYVLGRPQRLVDRQATAPAAP